jgi:hypothetical protein
MKVVLQNTSSFEHVIDSLIVNKHMGIFNLANQVTDGRHEENTREKIEITKLTCKAT